jgi:hypothetical protein
MAARRGAVHTRARHAHHRSTGKVAVSGGGEVVRDSIQLCVPRAPAALPRDCSLARRQATDGGSLQEGPHRGRRLPQARKEGEAAQQARVAARPPVLRAARRQRDPAGGADTWSSRRTLSPCAGAASSTSPLPHHRLSACCPAGRQKCSRRSPRRRRERRRTLRCARYGSASARSTAKEKERENQCFSIVFQERTLDLVRAPDAAPPAPRRC